MNNWRTRSVVVLLAVLGLLSSTAPAQAQETENRLPRFQDILYDVKAFSARARNAETDQEKIDALVDLCTLYLHLVSDERFARSQVLQGYRGRIAHRLRSEQRPIARALKQESSQTELSRWGDINADPAISAAVLDRNLHLLTQTAGGTGPLLYYASGMHGTSGHFAQGSGGGVLWDHGQELVNLIETVLHPDFWEPNGGVGTVYYYQPLRILIVRATTTVHEDLTALLERLR